MAVLTYTFQNGTTVPLFPSTTPPVSFDITHRRNTLVSDTRSMRRQTRSIGGVRIEASLKFPPMRKVEYAELAEFFGQIDGRNTIFAMPWPILNTAYTLTSGTINRGEYYNRADAVLHNQLMQSTGAATQDPPARDGGTVTLSPWSSRAPHLHCSLATDAPKITFGNNGFISYQIDIIERF